MERAQAEWWKPESVADAWSAGVESSVDQWKPLRSAVPFWSAMVFIAVVVFSPQSYFPALESIRPAMIPAVIGIGAYVVDRYAANAPFVMYARELRLLGALVAWAIFTIPFSMWPGGSVSFMTGNYLKTLALFWLLSHSAATLQRLRQTTWILSIMAVGLVMFALNNYLSGTFTEQNRVFGNEGALTKNPNDLALMMNIIIPLTMALLLSNTRPAIRTVLFGILIVEGVTVVSTYSRTGFLTLGTVLLAYAWRLRKRGERVWIYAILVLAVLSLPLLPSTYLDRMTTIVHTEKDSTGSAQERWTDMMIAAQSVASSPIKGAGVGMNALAMSEARGGGSLQVHNVYLELAMDLGLPGLLLFSWLLWTCIKSMSQVHQWASEMPQMEELACLAEGIQMSLLAFALAAMFQPVSYAPYFYYLAALAVATQAVFRRMSMQDGVAKHERVS